MKSENVEQVLKRHGLSFSAKLTDVRCREELKICREGGVYRHHPPWRLWRPIYVTFYATLCLPKAGDYKAINFTLPRHKFFGKNVVLVWASKMCINIINVILCEEIEGVSKSHIEPSVHNLLLMGWNCRTTAIWCRVINDLLNRIIAVVKCVSTILPHKWLQWGVP